MNAVVQCSAGALRCEETRDGMCLETVEKIQRLQDQKPLMAARRAIRQAGGQVDSSYETLRNGRRSTSVVTMLLIPKDVVPLAKQCLHIEAA